MDPKDKKALQLKRMINDCNLANVFHECRECKYRYSCGVKQEYERIIKDGRTNIQKSN